MAGEPHHEFTFGYAHDVQNVGQIRALSIRALIGGQQKTGACVSPLPERFDGVGQNRIERAAIGRQAPPQVVLRLFGEGQVLAVMLLNGAEIQECFPDPAISRHDAAADHAAVVILGSISGRTKQLQEPGRDVAPEGRGQGDGSRRSAEGLDEDLAQVLGVFGVLADGLSIITIAGSSRGNACRQKQHGRAEIARRRQRGWRRKVGTAMLVKNQGAIPILGHGNEVIRAVVVLARVTGDGVGEAFGTRR